MRQHPLIPETVQPPSQLLSPTPDLSTAPITPVTTSRPPLPRAVRSIPSKQPAPSRSPRVRYAEDKRSLPRSRTPPRRRSRHYRTRPRPASSKSPSIPRSQLSSPQRPPVKLRVREATTPEWPQDTKDTHWQDYMSDSQPDQYHQSSWSQSWDSKWTDPKWETRSSSWRSYDAPRDNRKTPPAPPRTAFTDKRRPTSGRDTSKLPSTSAPPPGKVPLADPSLKDEEWIQTVKKCLADKTRCRAANEIKPEHRPVLEDYMDKPTRDQFVANIRQIEDSIPASRIQSLLQVLGASKLLEEVDFRRVESLYLPNTSQRAMVVKLSHIKRFEEKPAFLHQANYSYAMIHGTNIIGAKYCLAEAMVRPADWSYCEILSKCEQPTYGCFSLGSCVTSRAGEIPNWNLVDLLDRASTKGKGQQEILLALQHKGAKEHLALKAGGNDMVQLQCALRGVVTTSEKYTVARSEHCTIRSLIVVWPDLSFVESRQGQSATYTPDISKEKSKEAPDDSPDDRPPDPEELRPWHRRGDHFDDEDET
eukprot:s747_g19.t1